MTRLVGISERVDKMGLCSECKHAIKPGWSSFMSTRHHPWRCKANKNPSKVDPVSGHTLYEVGGLIAVMLEAGDVRYGRCNDFNGEGECVKWEGE